MKLYRGFEVGERLRPGDERISDNQREWLPIQSSIGLAINADMLASYRRPVDLPVLQPVTPEAMAELEGREAWVILFRHKESIHCRYCVVRWDAVASRWWGTPAGEENPLDWQWYIEPSTIPEVT